MTAPDDNKPVGPLSPAFFARCDSDVARINFTASPLVREAQEMEKISHDEFAIKINTVE